ncbi:MAG: hypothetical protein QJQ54_00220 [Mollicutes bacterium]|nr:MAG: hypothetical protein QJQ54_00220 [Mollicutes bacterium]
MFLDTKSFYKNKIEFKQFFLNDSPFHYQQFCNLFQKTLKVKKKIELGQFFTNDSPFRHKQFYN